MLRVAWLGESLRSCHLLASFPGYVTYFVRGGRALLRVKIQGFERIAKYHRTAYVAFVKVYAAERAREGCRPVGSLFHSLLVHL